MGIFTAIIQKEAEMYIAKCPDLGTISQGKTIAAAVANLKEATKLYLEEFPLKKKVHPIFTTFEVAKIASS